jgi:hypothetical protein
MHKCPIEIWLQIFQVACTDDGSTGRSIALVSRFFHEISNEVKLQSLSVIGVPQIVACARMLEMTPPHFRRVRHLFVSNCLETPSKKTRTFPGQSRGFWELDVSTLLKFLRYLAITTALDRRLRGLHPDSEIRGTNATHVLSGFQYPQDMCPSPCIPSQARSNDPPRSDTPR